MYRAAHFWITGFYVPDEYGYTVMALKGLIGYQARWFFNGLNILFFDLFRVNQVGRLVVLLPLYIMFWISMILFSAYRTMKIFGYGDSIVRNTLMLVVFLPIFTIASLSFLSEVVSIGMAMLAARELGDDVRQRIEHLYWGPGFSNDEIEEQLRMQKVKYDKVGDIEGVCAQLVAKGKIVGWFQGRMEIGPRALGNRSILSDPRTVKSRDDVNKAKGRGWGRT